MLILRGIIYEGDPRAGEHLQWRSKYSHAPIPFTKFINFTALIVFSLFRAEEELAELYNLYFQDAVAKRGLRDPNDPR